MQSKVKIKAKKKKGQQIVYGFFFWSLYGSLGILVGITDIDLNLCLIVHPFKKFIIFPIGSTRGLHIL